MQANCIKYKIIYADPPWPYNARRNPMTKFSRGVHSHYSTMAVDEICSLPVADLADENCALVLWVTFPRLKEGIRVLEAWGFRYVTVAFNWFTHILSNLTPETLVRRLADLTGGENGPE